MYRVASVAAHKRKAVTKLNKIAEDASTAHAGHRTKVLSHMKQTLKVRQCHDQGKKSFAV